MVKTIGTAEEPVLDRSIELAGEQSRVDASKAGAEDAGGLCASARLFAANRRFPGRQRAPSVKDECLSKVILLGERSLRRALNECVEHYHAERNHQGKGNVILFPDDTDIRSETRDRTPKGSMPELRFCALRSRDRGCRGSRFATRHPNSGASASSIDLGRTGSSAVPFFWPMRASAAAACAGNEAVKRATVAPG